MASIVDACRYRTGNKQLLQGELIIAHSLEFEPFSSNWSNTITSRSILSSVPGDVLVLVVEPRQRTLVEI